jgi:hypothetical protein
MHRSGNYNLVKASYILGALFAAHLLLTLSLIPPDLLFGGKPIAGLDYALHFSRAVASEQFLAHFDRIWGYNPYFLAGYPAGTVFSVNNHFIEIFVFLMHRLGISLPTAFNLFVFFAFLLVPVFTWLAARNFRLTTWQQVIAAAMAMMLWIMDSQVRTTWGIGVIASGMAMYSLPFSLSCLYRYCENRTIFWYLCFLFTGILVSLLHPLSFLFFYGSVALYFIFRARQFNLRFWGALAISACVVLLINLFWILPLLQHWHLKTISGYHWIGNLKALGIDLLGYHDSGLRLIIYLFAGGGFITWWQDGKKERVRFILFPVLMLTLFGYVSGDIDFFRNMETYRNNLVASFLLILPASVFLGSGISYFRDMPHLRRLIIACVIVIVSLHLTGRNLLSLTPYSQGGLKHHNLQSLGKDEMDVVQWLKGNANNEHRIMVEYWPLGAMLPWHTGFQVIGGPYPLVWMPHNFVNFANMSDAATEGGIRLFGRKINELSYKESKSYLDTYNVGWIVVYTDESRMFYDSDTNIVPMADIGRYRIYKSADLQSFFLKGNGKVRAEYGSLHITEASDGELILKYHWTPSLVSDPPQELLSLTVLDDPVPFIKIPNNRFSDFVIRDR